VLRSFARPAAAGLIFCLCFLLSACGPTGAAFLGSAPLLAGVEAAPAVVSPNGQGLNAPARIVYTVGREVMVSIYLVDNAGRRYPLRMKEPRSPGTYEAAFTGAVKANPDDVAQWILPDGAYTYVIEAETPGGQKAEATGTVTIQGADPIPLAVSDVVALPTAITPNGDARDDKTVISYRVAKDAEVELYATDAEGRRYLVEPPTKRLAGHQSAEWKGFSSGLLAPNGDYQVHIVARDTSGNVAEGIAPVALADGGTPDLQILDVEFSPPTVPVSGTVNVKIRVKNTGDTKIETKGPPPGTAFTTSRNYFADTDRNGRPKYYDEAGKWRVAASWNQAFSQYPARWALTQPLKGPDGQVLLDENGLEKYPPLLPGEESIITGTIQVLIPETDELHFWGSYEKGGIGFGPTVGQMRVGISR
jgi:hypothetical protein